MTHRFPFRRHLRKASACVLAALLLAGCDNLHRLEEADPQARTFNSSLASEYLDYAKSEQEENHWGQANYFAGKGLRANRGEKVPPEEISKQNIPEDTQKEMKEAREHLLLMLGDNSLSVVPQKAARAQMLFDCWVSKTEHGAAAEEIASCHDEFMDSLLDLHESPGVMNTLIPHFEVRFDIGSTEVDDTGKKVIKDAAEVARNLKSCRITLIGHSDSLGGARMNQKISKMRAAAVKDLLEKNKLCTKEIVIDALGEASPRVRAPNGVAEPQNRRVEIEITRGDE